MNISELSIRRPVLATVLTIIILLFGLIGYNTLGVREYPSVVILSSQLLAAIPVRMQMLSRTKSPNPWNRISMVFPVYVPYPASVSKANAASR